MSLSTLLNRTLTDPLQAIGSRRAMGYLGWNVPVELILAADAVPVQLSAVPQAGDMMLADRFLENSFSMQSRAVAQRWLAGDLDALDAVIFSRSDDSAQRLYYYLCELQRLGECKGPHALLYDLARIGRGTSVAHTIESTRLLASALAADEARLVAAMERVASREAQLGELAKLRKADQVPLGSVAYRIVRGARADWSEEFDRALDAWLGSPSMVEPRQRVVLIGSVPSDEQLHGAIEVDGTVVVGEINEACAGGAISEAAARRMPLSSLSGRGNNPRSPLATTPHTNVGGTNSLYPAGSSPVESIARRCYEQTNAINALLQSPADLVKAARALRADGVIVWMLATDTGLAWQAPRIENALSEAGLPTLMLTSQPQSPSAEALGQIAQFRRMLEGR